ncbi:MAG: hypothetical protein R3Y05_01145 [bacterium]
MATVFDKCLKEAEEYKKNNPPKDLKGDIVINVKPTEVFNKRWKLKFLGFEKENENDKNK